MSRTTFVRLALAVLSLGLGTSSVHGQVAPIPSASGLNDGRAAVVVDSAMTTVGFALYVPAPPGSDAIAGQSSVVALALQDDLQERVSVLAAQVRVDLDPEGTVVSGQAAPDAIADLVQMVKRAAFESPLGSARVEARRAAVAAQLAFESGAPVRAFEREARYRIFNGFPHWRELTSGTAQSVGSLSAEVLGRAPAFDASARRTATAALVGPVVPQRARAMLQDLLAFSSTDMVVPDPPPTTGHAWTSGDTQTVAAEITRTWVAVAIPLRAEVPPWKQHLLTFHVREAFAGRSPNADLISPRVALLKPGGFPVLFVTFATQAEMAPSMAERVVATARLEVDGPNDDQFFGWTRRRFRNYWLLANTGPTARARTMVTGTRGPVSEAPWAPIPPALTREDLSDGARALGEPRVVIYGPTVELPEQP